MRRWRFDSAWVHQSYRDIEEVEGPIPSWSTKGGKISYLSLIIGVIFIVISAGGYIWYLEKSVTTLNMVKPLTVISNTAQTTDKTQQDCSQFTEKFGISADELIQFINNEPDSAIVLKGYLLIYTKITGLTPGAYLPIVFNLDDNGKIIKFDCNEPKDKRDYSQDVDFTIPETDLAQIIRYRETLEVNQASVYLQNVTTNPPQAKQIILERIQSLE